MAYIQPVYIPDQRALRILVLALFLGLLSFVAVREVNIQWEREPLYLGTDKKDAISTDKGDLIKVGERLKCNFIAGKIRISITLPPEIEKLFL